MTDSDHLKVLETWFDRVWNKKDAGAIDDMMAEKTPAKGLGAADVIGPKEFKAFHKQLLGLIDNVRITVEESLSRGDTIAARCMLKATSKQSGKPVTITGQTWVRIANGQLVDAYNHWDFMGLYEQLGLLPTDTFGCCLKGQRIG